MVCGAIVVLSAALSKVDLRRGIGHGLLKRIAVFVGILLPLVGFYAGSGDGGRRCSGLSEGVIDISGWHTSLSFERQLESFINPEICLTRRKWLPFVDPILPTSAGLHVDRQSIDVLLATGYLDLSGLTVCLAAQRAFFCIDGTCHALAMGARVFWDPKFEMGLSKLAYTLLFGLSPFSRNTACQRTLRHGNGPVHRDCSRLWGEGLAQKNRWAPMIALGFFFGIESIALPPAPWPVPHSNAGLHLISKELESAEGAVSTCLGSTMPDGLLW